MSGQHIYGSVAEFNRRPPIAVMVAQTAFVAAYLLVHALARGFKRGINLVRLAFGRHGQPGGKVNSCFTVKGAGIAGKHHDRICRALSILLEGLAKL
jgi:hypothetical protein